MGGHALIAKDFVGPEVEDEEVREMAKEKRRAILQSWKRLPTFLRRRHTSRKEKVEDPEKDGSSDDISSSEISDTCPQSEQLLTFSLRLPQRSNLCGLPISEALTFQSTTYGDWTMIPTTKFNFEVGTFK